MCMGTHLYDVARASYLPTLSPERKACNPQPVAGVVQKRLGESLGAVRGVFRNPELRRVELAWAGSVTGDWAYVVALAVFAWDAGGAAAVGLVGLIRFVPAAIAAPFAAVLA